MHEKFAVVMFEKILILLNVRNYKASKKTKVSTIQIFEFLCPNLYVVLKYMNVLRFIFLPPNFYFNLFNLLSFKDKHI